MKIELKKFGDVLTSRPAGREAFAAIRPTLDLNSNEVEIDFSDIISLSPSWADEFFSPLNKLYNNNIIFLSSDNPSVKATLEILNIK